MKKNLKKLIEKIVVFSLIGILVATLAIIPLASYSAYNAKLTANQSNQGSQSSTKPPKATLSSITATLKEGVGYYDNGKASPKAEDFIVTATYTAEGQDPYTETIDQSKVSITSADDFYLNGGDVTLTFRGKSQTLNFKLTPVAVKDIKVETAPYTVAYAVGQNFSTQGMTLIAEYNDGSKKILSNSNVTVTNGNSLQTSTNSVTLVYREGSVQKTVEVPITVTNTVNDGAVTRITVAGDAYVADGNTYSTATINVEGYYESGNRKALVATEYAFRNGSTIARMGASAPIQVYYKTNSSLTATVDAVVTSKIEGENCTIVGGSANTEDEYVETASGALVESGASATFAGGFSKTVQAGNEASISYKLSSQTGSVGSITVRASNSNCQDYKGAEGGYYMKPLQINTIMDLTVNGANVVIPDSIVLKGVSRNKEYAPLFNVYSDFTIDNVPLEPGENLVKFTFKSSTLGETNRWGESISTINVDNITYRAKGNTVAAGATVTDVEIGYFDYAAYTPYTNLNVKVIGKMSDGNTIVLTSDKYTLSFSGSDKSLNFVQYGDNEVTASLKTDASKTATKTFSVAAKQDFVVKTAELIVSDNKVLYVLTGQQYGYKATSVKFFDGATTYPLLQSQFTAMSFTIQIDVTDLAVGQTLYPHISLDGANYDNGGANNNGDIRGRGLTFADGSSVTLNGKTYTLTKLWEMPCVVVS